MKLIEIDFTSTYPKCSYAFICLILTLGLSNKKIFEGLLLYWVEKIVFWGIYCEGRIKRYTNEI